MIIGDISLDPRKIISGQIIRKRGKWYLSIMYEVGDSACQFNVKCIDFDSANLLLAQLDLFAHKDDLIDAISDKSLEEIEADLSGCYAKKLGFKC